VKDTIVVEASESLAVRVSCGRETICRIAADIVNGDLIDIIVAQVQPAVGSIQLNNYIFPKIEQGTIRPAKCGRWLFPVCQTYHWIAVMIDWDKEVLGYYDPLGEDRTQILTVGTAPSQCYRHILTPCSSASLNGYPISSPKVVELPGKENSCLALSKVDKTRPIVVFLSHIFSATGMLAST